MIARLIPALGGNGSTKGIVAMNDTGSDILTLYNDDFTHLGNPDGYLGWQAPVAVSDANGVLNFFPSIIVQVLISGDGWSSDWIEELALVRHDHVPRLSGAGVRGHLYFGTAPGNHYLAVATTKGGLASLL